MEGFQDIDFLVFLHVVAYKFLQLRSGPYGLLFIK